MHSLQARFDALEPELWATIRDPDHGVEGYVVVWTTPNARTAAKVDEAKHTTRTMVSANVAEVLDLAASAGASPVDAASLLALRRVFGAA